MALEVGASHAATHSLNPVTQPQADDGVLYDRLLKLRDVIVAGKHPHIKLSNAAIAELKASTLPRNIQADDGFASQSNAVINGSAYTTNLAQPQQSSSFPSFTGFPGLQASSHHTQNNPPICNAAKPVHFTSLDPIFLEKSDSLVRAEGQLKRQRLDRELQTQLDQQKHASRDRDQASDAPSALDVDLVLLSAWERVRPVSGLKEAYKQGSAASSSFDENDYYSSQAPSDWSSEAGSSKSSNEAEGAFTGDFERLDGNFAVPNALGRRPANNKALPLPGSTAQQPALIDSQDEEYEPGEVVEIEDEDDDYTPPDAAAFDSSRNHVPRAGAPVASLPEDDNSDYEPGEIADTIPPAQVVQQPAQRSPRVPIVRNHLTHLVAPQPSRVSPLATKDQFELELVNGRPEMVPKVAPRSNYEYSRATSASPSGNGVSGSGKKRRSKKRKRDVEPAGRSKRRRERQNGFGEEYNQDPFIKDEPMSPPPFANVPELPQQAPQYTQYRPSDLDLNRARPAQQYQYAPEPSRSGLRYDHAQPASPTVVRVASPAYRPLQRDNEDLRRRVVSLQHAQQRASPTTYSPQRTVSMTYGDQRSHQVLQPETNGNSPYAHQPMQEAVQYVRDVRSRSPPRLTEYREQYAERIASPSLMPPPPPVNTRPMVVDQYGNRYYMEGAAPPHAPTPQYRASAAPVDGHAQPGIMYEHVPSRSSATYAAYDAPGNRMAPPPLPSRRQVTLDQQQDYTELNGYATRNYYARATEAPQYAPAPTSPIYQEIQQYEPMPPPPLPPSAAHEPTSPAYTPRSYSVRPEAPPQPATIYARHASVAPPQYVRQDAPPPPPQMRAVSVMPGLEYSAPVQPQRSYAEAPQNVRYVDQHGNEVFPSQVRQVSEFRY